VAPRVARRERDSGSRAKALEGSTAPVESTDKVALRARRRWGNIEIGGRNGHGPRSSGPACEWSPPQRNPTPHTHGPPPPHPPHTPPPPPPPLPGLFFFFFFSLRLPRSPRRGRHRTFAAGRFRAVASGARGQRARQDAMVRSSRRCPAPTGRASVSGHDVARETEAVRAADGVTGQFSAAKPEDRPREPDHDGGTERHRDGRGRRARRALDTLRRLDAADRADRDLIRGHARRLDLGGRSSADTEGSSSREPPTGLRPAVAHTMCEIIRDSRRRRGPSLTTQYSTKPPARRPDRHVLDDGVWRRGTLGRAHVAVGGGHIRLSSAPAGSKRPPAHRRLR